MSDSRTTYLLASDGIIQATELGFAWPDALQIMWDGSYDAGAPRLIHLDLAAGTCADVTTAALVDLAERTAIEAETPAHLIPLFKAARIDFWQEPRGRRPPPATLPSLAGAFDRRPDIFGAHGA